jgi:hypothetical protein
VRATHACGARTRSVVGCDAQARAHPTARLTPPAPAADSTSQRPAVDAFVACGGNADTSGVVERATLVRIIKVDFGLTIDIEALIDSVDKDGSGEIEFGEFKELLRRKDAVVGS